MRRTSRKMRAVTTVVILGLGAAACGDDDDGGGEAATTTTAAADGTTVAPDGTAGPSAGEAIEVTAVDYQFQGLPETVPAGTMLTLVNTSTEELHELVALRLPDTEERSVEQLLALPEEELAFLGTTEPAVVMLAPPGETGFAVVGDGTLPEPGRYAVICAIPIGADPQAFLDAAEASAEGPPEVEGGPPHFTEGMFTELVVE